MNGEKPVKKDDFWMPSGRVIITRKVGQSIRMTVPHISLNGEPLEIEVSINKIKGSNSVSLSVRAPKIVTIDRGGPQPLATSHGADHTTLVKIRHG